MCTGFVFRGRDLLFGYNLDIDPAAWTFDLVRTDQLFSVAITLGRRTYYTHGVNRNGHTCVLPYMNPPEKARVRGPRVRIDLLGDRYLRGQYDDSDVRTLLATKAVADAPNASLHALLCDGAGNVLCIEPGYGFRAVTGRQAAIANFPLLTQATDENPWYGKDRYAHVTQVLNAARDDFGITDALSLLREVHQEGQWGTRLSFVYSKRDNAVYYAQNAVFDAVCTHAF